jgi:DNA-binding SARP family transcriptional activator
MAIRFSVLGPLEVWAGPATVRLPGGKQRLLLSALLVHRNEPLPRDGLVEMLWHGRPPPSAVAVLQNHVSVLR